MTHAFKNVQSIPESSQCSRISELCVVLKIDADFRRRRVAAEVVLVEIAVFNETLNVWTHDCLAMCSHQSHFIKLLSVFRHMHNVMLKICRLLYAFLNL